MPKIGPCDFCSTETRLGRVIVKCGRIDRTFAACHDCREAFEAGIARLIETGEMVTTVEKVRTVYEPVETIVTKTTMKPSAWLWADTALGIIIGAAVIAVAVFVWAVKGVHP